MKKTADPTFFIYPYVKTYDDFELRCSMLSIIKNFKGDYKIVVIGDKPLRNNIDYLYIPSERKSQRALDIHHKLQTIINDSRIPNNFVWMYDDIFFINPVELKDLKVVYANQDLSQFNISTLKFDASPKWQEMFQATMAIVKAANKPIISYETHLPRFLSKKKLQQIIIKYNLLNSRLLIFSLYYLGTVNPVFLKPKTDSIKLGIYMAFNDLNTLEAKIKNNLFLNYYEAAFTDAMRELLTNLFLK